MCLKRQINKETSTGITEMSDIIRIDLTDEIDKFSKHIQNKIDRLDERMRFVNYKFEDVRKWFKKYSISIIYLATFLTLIEALINTFDLECNNNIEISNIINFLPLILSSLISLMAAIIKFNKYEEKIEDITRATEKCIITIAKLKEVKEELYFCKTVDNFNKINDRFIRDIYNEYLESNTNIERQLLDTDYAKYMQKVAHNDVERAKILLKRNREIDEINEETISKSSNIIGFNIFNKNSEYKNEKKKKNIDENINLIKNDNNINNICNNLCKFSKSINLSSEHNSIERPIPYRGGSPALLRSHINNKKITSIICIYCNKNFLLELENNDQICPYCKKSQLDRSLLKQVYNLRENSIENIKLDSNINKILDIEKGISPTTMGLYAQSIQRIWRKHKKKDIKKKDI